MPVPGSGGISPRESMSSFPVVHLSMFVLRFFAGTALIYYQGWEQLVRGWNFVWHQQPWPLVDQFEQPLQIAVLFSWLTAVFYALSPLMLALGFLTRLNALLIFAGILFTLSADLEKVLSPSLQSQTVVLYLIVLFFFICNGGGMIAADRLFDRRRGRMKKAGGLYF